MPRSADTRRLLPNNAAPAGAADGLGTLQAIAVCLCGHSEITAGDAHENVVLHLVEACVLRRTRQWCGRWISAVERALVRRQRGCGGGGGGGGGVVGRGFSRSPGFTGGSPWPARQAFSAAMAAWNRSRSISALSLHAFQALHVLGSNGFHEPGGDLRCRAHSSAASRAASRSAAQGSEGGVAWNGCATSATNS